MKKCLNEKWADETKGKNMLRGKNRLDMKHSRYGRFCGPCNLKIFWIKALDQVWFL